MKKVDYAQVVVGVLIMVLGCVIIAYAVHLSGDQPVLSFLGGIIAGTGISVIGAAFL